MSVPRREVIRGDAVAWLRDMPVLEGDAYVASLPDATELDFATLAEWRTWFVDVAELVIARTRATAAVFYQTDVIRHGAWVDKAHLCCTAAERVGATMLWHKIGCRVDAGDESGMRPGYSHMLAFSRELRCTSRGRTPDVMPRIGPKDWSRAIGRSAAEEICRWLRAHTAATRVVVPFCGTGTLLAAANDVGLDALGLELDEVRARRAMRRR